MTAKYFAIRLNLLTCCTIIITYLQVDYKTHIKTHTAFMRCRSFAISLYLAHVSECVNIPRFLFVIYFVSYLVLIIIVILSFIREGNCEWCCL